MLSQRKVADLQQLITQTKKKLSEISKLEQPMPELINTTNMLRSNERLTMINEKQSQLLVTYEEYTKELEKLVLSISSIQAKIKDLKSSVKSRKTAKKKTHQKNTPRRKSVRKIAKRKSRKIKYRHR